jgi:hypothetical protein
MPYKPTGNPPGRPRKDAVKAVVEKPGDQKPRVLTRAREARRRIAIDVGAGLHQPPRFGKRRREREKNKKPILHPYVIAKV